jgi:sugar phosphate isomerase/epimerase
MTLRLGLSGGALYPDVPTEDVPSVAARLGVADVELMLQTPGEYGSAFVREVAANCRAAGIRVHAVHTYQSLHPLFTPYRRRTEEARTLFDRGIAAAAELGARALIWHGMTREEARVLDAWERFIAATAELAGACGAAGVTLAIENVSWCVVSTAREVMALAARLPEIGPPETVGFAFDPFQAAEAGANPFMILAAMEGRIVDVHISDHKDGDPTARHLPPGDGDLPWPALVRAIASSGYDGPLISEGAMGADSEATMARIRRRFDPLLAALAPESDPCAGSLPPGVLAGIRLFNERKYYEAHEEIEHEWHAERGSIRRLYQGILQIGVGFHHARAGNQRGAVLLLTDGIAKTSQFLPSCRGVDTARLVEESQVCLERIIALGSQRLDEFNWEMAPLIEYR